MKLINNDYRVLDTYVKSKKEEAYLVEKVNQPGRVYFLKIIEPHKSNRCIQDFIENFQEYENIRHRYLLNSYEFGLIKNLNLKPISGRLYYVLSEYTDNHTLEALKGELSARDMAIVLAKIMEVLDYLHFRGFTYRALSPEKIYISADGDIRLLNISTLIEHLYENERINSIQEFIAPEIFCRDVIIDRKADYYSLGVLIKKYLYPLIVGDKTALPVIDSIVEEFIKKEPGSRNMLLIEARKKIEELFDFSIGTDYLKERDFLNLGSIKAIGHESQLLELEQLEDFIDSNSSLYNIALIEGNIGSGKTYLLQAFLRKAALRGGFTAEVSIAGGKTIGLDSFRDFILDFLAVAQIKYKLTNQGDGVKLIHEDVDMDFSLNLPGSLYKLYDIIAENLIRRSKTESIFLGINDLELSSSSILEMIDFLFTKFKGNRILLICTYNQMGAGKDSERLLEDWANRNGALRIKTSNLSLESTGRLVKSILGIAFIPKDFSQLLYKESLGNTRYLVHLLRHFYDTGELYMSKEGVWNIRKDRYDDLKFPNSFVDAFKNRIDSLSPKQLYLLQMVSCFEGSAKKALIKKLTGFADVEFNELLISLEAEGLISEDNNEYGQALDITEGEIKKYIYSMLDQSQRESWHKSIADELLNDKKLDNGYNFEELFYQLSSSKQFEELIDIAYERIGIARNMFTDSSIVILTQVYDILSTSGYPKDIEILDKLCYSLIVKGETAQLKDYLDKLMNAAESRGNDRFIVRWMLYKLEFSVRSNDILSSQELINEISKGLEGKDYVEEEIYHKLLQAKHYLDVDNPVMTESMADEGITLSESNNIWTYVGDLFNVRGIAKYMLGDPESAIVDYNRALEGYKKSDRPFDMVKPINNIGSIQSEYYGSEKLALDYYWRCVEISESYGLTSLQTTFLSNIGEAFINVRDYKNAEIFLDRAIDLSKRIDDKKSLFLSTVLQGIVYLILGRINRALEINLSLKEMNKSVQIQDKEVLMQYTNFLGQFYFETGDFKLSKEFSKISMERSLDISKKEYMKAKNRLINIDFIEKSSIDKDMILEIVEEYKNSGSSYDRAYFLLLYGLIAHYLNDEELSKSLIQEYKNLDSEEVLEKYQQDLELIELIIEGSNSSLISAIDHSKSAGSNLLIPKLYSNLALAVKLSDSGLYYEAFTVMINNLDYYETAVRMLGEEYAGPDFRRFYMLDLMIPIIDRSLFSITGFNRDFEPRIENYLNKLDEQLFLRIFSGEEASRCCIDTTKLLSALDSNFSENLDKILEFIAIKTNAEHGYIVLYDTDGSENRVIKYGAHEDFPLNLVIENTIKDEQTVLIRRDISSKQCHILEMHIEEEISGFIVVPILTSQGFSEKSMDRRQSYVRNNIYGYVLLLTRSNVNRFDNLRSDLIKDLTWLIYLNSENDRLYRSSFYDKLTGTYRRNVVEKRLSDAIQHHSINDRGFACLMLDIDRFKSINDTYGHQIGDKVLTSIGEAIRESVRITDTAGRYGGEEFLLIIEDVDSNSAAAVAEKIRSSIESMTVKGLKQKVTASIGVSLYPEDGQLPEDLILRADQAMYHAKEVLGRNSVALWNDNMGSIASKFKLEHDLVVGGFENDSDRIGALSDTALLIQRNMNLKDKLDLFLGYLLDSTQGSNAAIYSRSDNQLKCIAVRSKTMNDADILIPYDYLHKVSKSGESESYIYLRTSSEGDEQANEYVSGAICPIIINGDVYGLILVEVPLSRREFKQKDLKYIEVLGSVFSANLV